MQDLKAALLNQLTKVLLISFTAFHITMGLSSELCGKGGQQQLCIAQRVPSYCVSPAPGTSVPPKVQDSLYKATKDVKERVTI